MIKLLNKQLCNGVTGCNSISISIKEEIIFQSFIDCVTQRYSVTNCGQQNACIHGQRNKS